MSRQFCSGSVYPKLLCGTFPTFFSNTPPTLSKSPRVNVNCIFLKFRWHMALINCDVLLTNLCSCVCNPTCGYFELRNLPFLFLCIVPVLMLQPSSAPLVWEQTVAARDLIGMLSKSSRRHFQRMTVVQKCDIECITIVKNNI